MDILDRQQIKELCEEALDIADQYGLSEGLSYLIGQKFYHVLRKLKQAQEQLKYLYHDAQLRKTAPGKSALFNQVQAVPPNYRELLDKMNVLEKTRNEFVREIMNSFDVQDIQEFLNTFPRLGMEWDSPFADASVKAASFTAQEILAEAQDILCVEEMRRLFTAAV